jgi:predicted Rossmann fold flavoprotein
VQHNENSLREKFVEQREDHPAQKIYNGNLFRLPQRLWEFLAAASGIDENLRWADLPAAKRNLFVKNVCALEMNVEGKTTYKEEFVTAGGIRVTEVDAATMQSRKAEALYFAGEILDVDGITGGFNFQHAWTSGWIAAKSIAARASHQP